MPQANADGGPGEQTPDVEAAAADGGRQGLDPAAHRRRSRLRGRQGKWDRFASIRSARTPSSRSSQSSRQCRSVKEPAREARVAANKKLPLIKPVAVKTQCPTPLAPPDLPSGSSRFIAWSH